MPEVLPVEAIGATSWGHQPTASRSPSKNPIRQHVIARGRVLQSVAERASMYDLLYQPAIIG